MRRVTLFARPPVPGSVKTRLSPALPAESACALYRGLLRDALEALAAAPAGERYVYWAEPPGDVSMPVPAGVHERLQQGTDLGARLEAAFAELLRAPGDLALILGADCPELSPERIGEGLAALGKHDLALGPTLDGGYYAIGLTRPEPALFRDIAWGSSSVHAQTLERAGALSLRVAELPPLTDLDTPEDLIGLIRRALDRSAKLPAHTARALAELGLLPESQRP